jgi:hypothetical protein
VENIIPMSYGSAQALADQLRSAGAAVIVNSPRAAVLVGPPLQRCPPRSGRVRMDGADSSAFVGWAQLHVGGGYQRDRRTPHAMRAPRTCGATLRAVWE